MSSTITCYPRRVLTLTVLGQLTSIAGPTTGVDVGLEDGALTVSFANDLTAAQADQVTALLCSVSDAEESVQAVLRNALAADRAYLTATSTTTAQDKAQVRALTRQTIALIRFATRSLDGTD